MGIRGYRMVKVIKDLSFFDFQTTAEQWFYKCFPSHNIKSLKKERSLRFAEESIELLQATGLSKEQVLAIVDSVYNKPSGDVLDELGDALLAINLLACSENISTHIAAAWCMARVSTDSAINIIRKKQEGKIKAGQDE